MCPGAEAGISNYLRGTRQVYRINFHSLWDLRGRGEDARENIKRCFFDKGSKPLFFHISFLAIKISSHLYRL